MGWIQSFGFISRPIWRAVSYKATSCGVGIQRERKKCLREEPNQGNNRIKCRSRGYMDTVREEGEESFATRVEE
ncbi:hypothetical protein BDM02DRAFT_2317014 [Thelephora ganbajun]|uniref:Uncharacterized protein n=1 Tax=Thelephora ganbajun TaxID=370292 RepID=A0ACB6ZFT0_THEGA|nr:hypothetical protein BDM02DRAFT_2317014 [Thelephora ganbajun]